MIKYVTGNLISDAQNYDVIGHGCNCFCQMNSGIAPLIKANFPEAYEVDQKTKIGDKEKLGTFTHTQNTTPVVVNLYSQYDFRGRRIGRMDLDYQALRSALKLMQNKFTGKRIALPKIGAGLAGGDWTIIERIIEEVFYNEDVTVVVLPENI